MPFAEHEVKVDQLADELQQLSLEDAEWARLAAYPKALRTLAKEIQREGIEARQDVAERVAYDYLLLRLAQLMIEANHMIVAANKARTAAFLDSRRKG